MWERAYAAHREADDRIGAVRVARTLAYMNFSIVGDGAVGSGWLARAQTLLAGDDESSEAGWVALNIGMFAADRDDKEANFRAALDSGRRFGDSDLEFVVRGIAFIAIGLGFLMTNLVVFKRKARA
jgi:hypothetical protein